MRHFQFAVLFLGLAGLAIAKADVITPGGLTDGSGDPFSDGPTTNFGQGVQFTVNTGSSAGSGKWALQSIGFEMQTATGTWNITGINAQLYSVASGTNILTLLGSGSRTWTGGSTIGTTASSFSIDLDGLYGSADGSTPNTGLSSGNSYFLSWDILGSGTDFAWTQSTGSYSGAWTANASYGGYNQGQNLAGTDVTTLLPTGNPYGYSLNAAAVPEPGTLILGSIAALGGAGGWWARRKRKAVVAEETVSA